MQLLSRYLGGLLLSGVSFGAAALPTIQSTEFFTDRWGPSTAFPTLNGDYLHLSTVVASPDAPAQVSATATQGALIRPLNFFTGPIFAEKNYERYLTNTTLTGAWDLLVTDTSGSTTGTFAAIADPEFLPLLQNLQVTGLGTTPTISWAVPDLTGFDADAIRVRAVVAATGEQTFQSGLLPITATSFAMPSGILQLGVGYQFRILLQDGVDGRLENRSNTFSEVYAAAAPIPEPETYALMLAGLAGFGAYARWVRRRPTTV